jgi:limonene-1,2-epoxide hydrolase
MKHSPDEVVTEFCKKWLTADPDELAGYFTEDAVYHNIPMAPVQGREAIKEFIAGFTAGF